MTIKAFLAENLTALIYSAEMIELIFIIQNSWNTNPNLIDGHRGRREQARRQHCQI